MNPTTTGGAGGASSGGAGGASSGGASSGGSAGVQAANKRPAVSTTLKQISNTLFFIASSPYE
jgi:hypothetical protein